MSSIIKCNTCGKTFVTNVTNVYRNILCPHCEQIASPALKWKNVDEAEEV